MPRESLKNKRARTEKIIAELKTAFPDARCSLVYDTPLQLLIATILSAQCTDERVNAVTKELFQVYATAESFAEAPQAEIEDLIRSTGFFTEAGYLIRWSL